MKQKIFILGSILFAIFFINLFNNFFVSLIYSKNSAHLWILEITGMVCAMILLTLKLEI